MGHWFGKAPAVPRAPSPLALEEAVRRLQDGGLQGSIVPCTPPRIVGGSRSAVVAGSLVYEQSFSIEPHGRVWLVRMEHGERHVEEVHTDSLENAVRLVLSVRNH